MIDTCGPEKEILKISKNYIQQNLKQTHVSASPSMSAASNDHTPHRPHA